MEIKIKEDDVMQQLSRSSYENLQVFKLGSGTKQNSNEYLQRAKVTMRGQRTELDFSKMLDREMQIPALAVH